MKKSIVQNAFFSVLGRTMNVLFPLISHMYISRVLLPEGVGIASYAQTVVLYFVSFANLGIPTYGIRSIAREDGSQEGINRVFSELFSLNAVSTTFFCAAYYLMVSFLPAFREYRSLYWILGIQVFLVYCNIDWLYQGLEDYRFIALRGMAVKIASLLALVLLVHSRDDLLLYGVVLSIGGGGNYFLNIFHARKLVRFTRQGLNIRQHIRPVLVMFVCCTAVDLYGKIDVTMLGNFCESETVGYYSNAQRLVTAVVTAVTAVSVIFLPRLSLLYKTDRARFRELASSAVQAILFLALPCFVGLELVASDLVPLLFGEAFLPAVPTLRILGILIFLKSIGDVVCYQVIMSVGRERTYMRTYLAAVAVNIALNALLIPRLAQNGAAAASVLSELFVEVILFGIAAKYVSLRVPGRYLGSLCGSCLIMGAAVYGICCLPLPQVLRLAAAMGGGAAVYFAAAIVLKNPFAMSAEDYLKNRLLRRKENIL